MAAPAGIFNPDDDIYYPLEYKIVDLPVVEMPVMHTLKTYQCKIYRRCENGEWKRKCFGKAKFVEKLGQVVVAAFENGSCLNRLTEIPVQSQNYYKLIPSA